MDLRCVVLLIAFASSISARATPRDDSDAYLTTPELITKYGYPAETHTVTTEDGYILTLHRIPHGKDSTTIGTPILVQHGALSSSADWVVMGPGKALAYILADAGYDVWLGNCRGNTYSRKHVSLDPENSDFWAYSWHEMGIYDLPAVIDYILANGNGEQKLFYVGHSMGTTMFFVMGSERPEYNNKIRASFQLAPVAYMSHVKSPGLIMLAFAGPQLEYYMQLMGYGEFLPHSDFNTLIGQTMCTDSVPTQIICSNSLFLLAGYDSVELNETMLPVIMGHSPAGSSTKQLLHFAQSVGSGLFRYYDYGMMENLLIYGSYFPPEYDLAKVTAPTALLYGLNDILAVDTDDEMAIISKRLVPVLRGPDLDAACDKVTSSPHYGFLLPDVVTHYLRYTFMNDGKFLMHVVEECALAPGYIGYPVKRNWPGLTRLNQLIQRMVEGGFVTKWHNDVDFEYFVTGIYHQPTSIYTPRPMNLEHLQGAFIVLVGGLSCSCVILGAEYTLSIAASRYNNRVVKIK